MAAHRFPPPWTIDEANNACFIFCDSSGALGYFYFEDEPGDDQWRSCSRGIAVNVAGLLRALPKKVKPR